MPRNKVLFACMFLFGLATCDNAYYKQGENLYKSNCSSCHMDDGSGLSNFIPPLNLTSSKDTVMLGELVCVISKGINNPDSILQMPPHPQLTDIEITNLINFLLNDMSKKNQFINLDQTKSYLSQCDD